MRWCFNLAITFNLLHFFSNFRALYYAMMAGTVSLPCGEPWHFFYCCSTPTRWWYVRRLPTHIISLQHAEHSLNLSQKVNTEWWLPESNMGYIAVGPFWMLKCWFFANLPIPCNTYLFMFICNMHFKSTITTVFCFLNFEIALCVHFAMNILKYV